MRKTTHTLAWWSALSVWTQRKQTSEFSLEITDSVCLFVVGVLRRWPWPDWLKQAVRWNICHMVVQKHLDTYAMYKCCCIFVYCTHRGSAFCSLPADVSITVFKADEILITPCCIIAWLHLNQPLWWEVQVFSARSLRHHLQHISSLCWNTVYHAFNGHLRRCNVILVFFKKKYRCKY